MAVVLLYVISFFASLVSSLSVEEYTVSLEFPTHETNLKDWVSQKTAHTCESHDLSTNQCLALLRYLTVSIFFRPKKFTYFFHNSTRTFKSPEKVLLRLHLMSKSALDVVPSFDSHLSPSQCFSKTFLTKKFPAKCSFEVRKVLHSVRYGDTSAVDSTVFEKYAQRIGIPKYERPSVLKKVQQYVDDENFDQFSVLEEKHLISFQSENLAISELTTNSFLDMSPDRLRTFAQTMHRQLVQCVGIESHSVEASSYRKGYNANFSFILQNKECPASYNHNGDNTTKRLIPLNLWNYAFDKTLFVNFENCKIKYMKPNLASESPVHRFAEASVSHVSLLREPVAGTYFLYFYNNIKKNRRRAGEKYTKVLHSSDGIVWAGLDTGMYQEMKSNVAITYPGRVSGNFFPMVDYSTCLVSDEDNFFLVSDSTNYHIRNSTLQNFDIPLFTNRIKGIVGTDTEGMEKISANVGVFGMVSSDGKEWFDQGQTPLLRSSQAATAGFQGVYFDTVNNLLYDHDEKRYKIFARHNTGKQERMVQMFVSGSECDWNKYGNGTPMKFPDGLIHNQMAIYSPNANALPSSKYIIFIASAYLTKHSNCPTYVSFLYSVDGGRTAYNDIASILEPSVAPDVLFQKCASSGKPLKVNYHKMGTTGVLESVDCTEWYIYTLQSGAKFPVWDPTLLFVHKYRYGGFAAIESSDWGEDRINGVNGISTFRTKLFRVPANAKMMVLNYETKSPSGLLRVGFENLPEPFSNKFDIANSCIYRGSSLAQRLCWNQTQPIARRVWNITEIAGKVISFKVELIQARFYGFMFAENFHSYKDTVASRGSFCAHKFDIF